MNRRPWIYRPKRVKECSSFLKATTTKRKTMLPWMGGKSRLAATIIERLPEHTTYVEPFCGGAAVFFRKPRSKVEIINDQDNRLITLFRVFRHHPDELLRELQYLTHSRSEFVDAIAQPGLTDIQRAARFYMLVLSCFGSRMSSPTFGYGITSKSHFTLASATDLIYAARERLDGVTIENDDFEAVIKRYDSPATLFYCDPPYIQTAEYACKFTMEDQERLRNALMSARGKAVVSLNDCPKARQLYADWDISEVEVQYSIGRTSDRQKQNKEIIISKKLSN